MAYIVYLSFSALVFYLFRREGLFCKKFWLDTCLCFPVLFFYVFLIGGQYGVGTDYHNYYEMFLPNSELRFQETHGEYGWIFLIRFFQLLGIQGQGIFVAIAAITGLVLFYSARMASNRQNLYICWFVFITCSPIFHNQMNGVRQALASFLGSLAILFWFNDKRFFATLLFLISPTIHRSYIFFLVIIVLFLWISSKRNGTCFLISVLLLSIPVSYISMNSVIELGASAFPQFAYFVERERWLIPISFMNRMTRYAFVPVVLWAIMLRPKMRLTDLQNKLFNIGVLLFSFRIFSLSAGLFFRIGWGCEILMYIPVAHLLQCRFFAQRQLLAFFLFLYYLLKVTFFAAGEYSYTSCISLLV